MEGNLFLIITEGMTSTRGDGKLTLPRMRVIKQLGELIYKKITQNLKGLEKKAYMITTTETDSEEGASIILEYLKEKKILYKKDSYEKLWVEDSLTIEDPLISFLYEKIINHDNYSAKIVCARRNILVPFGHFINKENLNIKGFKMPLEYHAFNFQSKSYTPLKVEL